MTAPGEGAKAGGGGVGEAVAALVRATVAGAGQAGRQSADALGQAVEAPGRAVARRVTAQALARPPTRPLGDRASLAAALGSRATRRAPVASGGAAMAAKLAGRVGPLRFLARRTPMWMLVAAAPALRSSIARGADELGLVVSYLVGRARDAGVQPDPDRLRRAAVQIVSGLPVDPGVEPSHARLALAWIERAAREALPLAAGTAMADPEGVARAADEVSPRSLGAGLQ
ncbi:MAG: hypothetical protein ABIW46_04900 [Acidimicrobiales bacterium]